jgi:hypothetical protein
MMELQTAILRARALRIAAPAKPPDIIKHNPPFTGPQDFERPLVPRLTAKLIAEEVCAFYGVTMADIASHSRRQPLCRVRQVACYLAREMTPRRLLQIGQLVGGRDHSTAHHAHERIKALLVTDRELTDEIQEIKARLPGVQSMSSNPPPNPPQPVRSAPLSDRDLLALWRAGSDTCDLAARSGEPEGRIESRLWQLREQARNT